MSAVITGNFMIENTTVSCVARIGSAVNDSASNHDASVAGAKSRDARVNPTSSFVGHEELAGASGIVRSSLLVVGAALMVMCASIATEIAGWSALAERVLSAPAFTGAVILVFAVDHVIGRARRTQR
jgi:hypothetical protein